MSRVALSRLQSALTAISGQSDLIPSTYRDADDVRIANEEAMRAQRQRDECGLVSGSACHHIRLVLKADLDAGHVRLDENALSTDVKRRHNGFFVLGVEMPRRLLLVTTRRLQTRLMQNAKAHTWTRRA